MDSMSSTQHHGGRPARPLTGRLRCARCGLALGVDSRTSRQRIRQRRYSCPRRHLAVLAEPLEAVIAAEATRRALDRLSPYRLTVLARQRRPTVDLAAVLRGLVVDVLPGRPGATAFEPSRLRVAWVEGVGRSEKPACKSG